MPENKIGFSRERNAFAIYQHSSETHDLALKFKETIISAAIICNSYFKAPLPNIVLIFLVSSYNTAKLKKF